MDTLLQAKAWKGKSRESTEPDAFDAKTYAIYLLTEGSITEKRELLSNLKSKLILKNRVISLNNEETPGGN